MNKEDMPVEVSALVERVGVIDTVTSKIISRKFLVFVTATALLAWSDLESDTWGMIAMIYIGSQAVIDAALAWKHGPNR
jgi:hypothetical protein